MKKFKLLIAVLLMTTLIGCAVTVFNKQATMMPDELWLAVDVDPHEDGSQAVTEVTTGFKWKLK
jgi:hypothetical protein